MSRKLTWLHLSDLHACQPKTGWDAKRVLDTLLADLKKMKADYSLRPDLIFFTGDAAFGQVGTGRGEAMPDQFREANDFLTAVRESFEPSIPKRNLFLVPGNHDVNRTCITHEDTEWLAKQDKLDDLEVLIRDGGSDWQKIIGRLRDYKEFVEKHGYNHLMIDRERLIYADMLELNDAKIGIAGFNSAWSSRGAGREEMGRLWMAGRFQLETIRRLLPEHDFSIALVHHPGNWLVPEENPSFFRDLERDFQFVLHGHEHQEFVRADATSGHTVLSAGACHEWSQGKNNGYNFVRLDLDAGSGEVWLREYESVGGGWRARVIKNKTDDEGRWPLCHLRSWLGEPSGLLGGSTSPNGHSVRSWTVPFAQNPFFTGREQLLVNLRDRLTDSSRPDGPRFEGIFGLGGCGKTQVAAEYAYRYREKYYAVLWLRAGSESQMRESLREVAQDVGIRHEATASDFDSLFRDLSLWLTTHENWLIIADGADHPAEIASYLPHNGNGHLLLTSRSPNLDSARIPSPIDLNVFEPGDAAEFLTRRVGNRELDEPESEAIRELASELGYLPLALEQAAAFIAAKMSRFRDYLASYRHRQIELLESMKPVAGGYPASVATTWSLNFEEVELLSPASVEMLKMLAFLAPDDIPLELFVFGLPELTDLLKSKLNDINRDPLQIDELLEPLLQFSLVRRNTRRMTVSVHQLVQSVVRAAMSDESKQEWSSHVVRAVEQSFLIPTEFVHWRHCWRLMPHALLVIQHIERYGLEIDDPGYLLNRVAYFLTRLACHPEAKRLHSQALSLRKAKFGDNDWRVAVTLHNLGSLAIEEGQFETAEALLTQAISIYEGSHKVNDEDFGAALSCLGTVLTNLSRFTEAEQAYERALRISVVEDDSTSPHFAIILHNLASLYATTGKLEEAEMYALRSKKLQDKRLHPNDPERVGPLCVLARICSEREEYVRAEALLQEALSIAERALGRRHPDVAMVRLKLADVVLSQNRSQEAEEMLASAIDSLRAALRPNHPSLATALEHLGVLYGSIGRFDDAERVHLEAERIVSVDSGGESVLLADLLTSRGHLLMQLEKFDEAGSTMRRALSIVEKLLGPDNFRVAQHLLALSKLSERVGDPTSALKYAERRLEVMEEFCGEAGTPLLFELNRVGNLRWGMGDFVGAVALLRRAVEISESSQQPDLAGHKLNLAVVLDQTEDHGEASQLCKDALDQLEGGTIKDAVNIGRGCNLLGKRLCDEGQYAEAEKYLLRAFQEWEKAKWPHHRDAIGTLTTLSTVYINSNRLNDAERLCDKILALVEATEGIQTQQLAACYNVIACLYEEKHELRTAEKWYRKAYAVWEDAGWPRLLYSVIAIDNLAQNLCNQERANETGPLLDQSVDQLARIVGDDHEDVALRLNDVAGMYQNLGDSAAAEKRFIRALQIWASKGWPNVPLVRRLQCNATYCFMDCGKKDLAERTARQAVAHGRKWLPETDPELIEPLFMLGMVLRQSGSIPEAERVLKEALTLIESGPGDSHPCLPGVLSAYAMLLRDMGKRSGKARRMEARAERLRQKNDDSQS